MGTKITVIAMGLALIVTVRDYVISQMDNKNRKQSSVEIIKEAFSIVKTKIRKENENGSKKSKNFRRKKYYPLRPRSKQDTV